MTAPLPELPELPASQMNVEVWDSEVRGLHNANAAYFTADQMHAYGLACFKAGMERAAEIADQWHAMDCNASDAAFYIRREVENV